jgi:hypothetical protein
VHNTIHRNDPSGVSPIQMSISRGITVAAMSREERAARPKDSKNWRMPPSCPPDARVCRASSLLTAILKTEVDHSIPPYRRARDLGGSGKLPKDDPVDRRVGLACAFAQQEASDAAAPDYGLARPDVAELTIGLATGDHTCRRSPHDC